MKGTCVPFVLACCLLAAPALAEEAWVGDTPQPLAGAPPREKPRGRPTVKLDRLELPQDTPNAAYFKKRLREHLRREARRADWGAGRGSTITYRFFVKKLDITVTDGVLRVSCTAIGRLPKGKTAKGSLSFGGPPHDRNAVVNRVLQIVARGVITRLAELERIRRGDLTPSSVRHPVSGH